MEVPKRSDDRPTTCSVAEAGDRIGIGRDAAYEGVRKGEIPAIRVGRRWRVLVVPLEKMLGLS